MGACPAHRSVNVISTFKLCEGPWQIRPLTRYASPFAFSEAFGRRSRSGLLLEFSSAKDSDWRAEPAIWTPSLPRIKAGAAEIEIALRKLRTSDAATATVWRAACGPSTKDDRTRRLRARGAGSPGDGRGHLGPNERLRKREGPRAPLPLRLPTAVLSRKVGHWARVNLGWWRAAWVFGRPVRSQGQCGPFILPVNEWAVRASCCDLDD
eukprot:GHVT01080826.1.p2 GENE.GHVT01080826.1~~GHVT01080826.1.p2  ORF type:complete len:209 (-),score=25.59 GHVT01080826.1:934-1560(-)